MALPSPLEEGQRYIFDIWSKQRRRMASATACSIHAILKHLAIWQQTVGQGAEPESIRTGLQGKLEGSLV